MYGAIFGDIIGSRFEFDRGGRTKDFELFTSEDGFTDDTVMTVAVGEALMKAGKEAGVEEIRKSVIESMQRWGHEYPNAGYGGRFYGWLFGGRNPKPYGSYGNGSAMRVSAAGWLYDSLERTREVARATAEVTHNHPEGIKGAECTAAVMYMARTGCTKEEILAYVSKEFGYDLSESLDEMRGRHKHDETCQDSLPKALKSFFEGESYEDVVRNAVSLGGDTDTLAAIAGAMAEAFYGMPIMIMAEGKSYLRKDMLAVLERFDRIMGNYSQEDEDQEALIDNDLIKATAERFFEDGDDHSYSHLLQALLIRAMDEGEAIAPMVDKNHVMDSVDFESMVIGQELTIGENFSLTIDKVEDKAGKLWVPLYTDEDEINKGETPNIRTNVTIMTILQEACYYEKSMGLVVNPFGKSVTISKEIIKKLLEECKYLKEHSIVI